MKSTTLFFLAFILCILLTGCQPSGVSATATATASPSPLTLTPTRLPSPTPIPPTATTKPTSTPGPTITLVSDLENALPVPSATPSPGLAAELTGAILYSYQDQDIYYRFGILVLPEQRTINLPKDLVPVSWSPSGAHLLLWDVLDNALYLAGPYGENPELLYKQLDEGVSWGPIWWLDEDTLVFTILIGAYLEDLSPEPEDVQVGLLHIPGRKYEVLQRDELHWVVAVDPLGQFWVEYRSASKQLELISRGGTREPLWQGLVEVPWRTDPDHIFSPSGTGLYSFVKENYLLVLRFSEIVAGKPQPPQPLVTLDPARSYRISPGGEYVGMVDYDMQFLLLDLKTNEIIRQMPWVGTQSSEPSIVWSPSSRWIATDVITKTKPGVVVLDVLTGKTAKIPFEVDSIFVLDWRILPAESALP